MYVHALHCISLKVVWDMTAQEVSVSMTKEDDISDVS